MFFHTFKDDLHTGQVPPPAYIHDRTLTQPGSQPPMVPFHTRPHVPTYQGVVQYVPNEVVVRPEEVQDERLDAGIWDRLVGCLSDVLIDVCTALFREAMLPGQ